MSSIISLSSYGASSLWRWSSNTETTQRRQSELAWMLALFYFSVFILIVQGVFFQLVPPRKVLSMELVPPNSKKWLSTLVPHKTQKMIEFLTILNIMTLFQIMSNVRMGQESILQMLPWTSSNKRLVTESWLVGEGVKWWTGPLAALTSRLQIFGSMATSRSLQIFNFPD